MNEQPRAAPNEKAIQHRVGERWTPALVQGGWTPVSDFFLEWYRHLPLPLSNLEAMLVIHLIKHKWTRQAPWPSFKRLANRMGLTPTAVRNHARNLEKKGYLRRIERRGRANQFDLTPLFSALERLGPEQARPERQKADARPLPL